MWNPNKDVPEPAIRQVNTAILTIMPTDRPRDEHGNQCDCDFCNRQNETDDD